MADGASAEGAVRHGVIDTFALLEQLPGLVHGVSTRAVGDLKTPQARARFAAVLGVDPSSFVRGRQVHGNELVVLEAPPPGGVVGDRSRGADAIATTCRGLTLLSLAADCVPVALVDPEAHVVAVAHAGWRGLAQGIVERTVADCAGRLGARPARMRAAIGPAIGPCCYEVGPEVVAALASRPGAEEAIWTSRAEPEASTRLDLPALARAALLAAGLRSEHVATHGACTRCERHRFFSYRAGDRSARFGFAIGWRD